MRWILAFAGIIGLLISTSSPTTTAQAFSGWSNPMPLIAELTWWGLITNILFSLVWQFVDMSAWESLASTKGTHDSRSALIQSALWVFVFPGLAGTILGMYLRGLPKLASDDLVPRTVELLQGHP